ncbi:Extracellular solute-binding protein family 3 OS=Tsukamurella paurometabola (strain ATCC 8368 / DSM / CCUG 35730 / CIP 100753 / JCM 10117 / KCTC 9821 /NBRC 16120 / NCIMB 702349 / NCTC 13040) OX=521096 GN=Tpau_1986 PE=4 SV=1 [Tsukamurella paurometabola]|uniref:Extracellular solute-binding protein family 3 n=1 Tax=Tsukamurella paurometabola (strain ATCC 8368 / DSM 20162 / CCUG 35730 / CIP 100753 / JCM 10117 / KCTC 9821 / NBRC 16120 / NCIMB 702349 / NCTC 13040) TaxID=521096 RepID=D5UNN0_TSUPD|nr:transporter substrate-binding domain-containing protein [Tsukamurella paurometabola]ADG78598.1 extracellular solute-binding protein family 3 [Tsukamurella paurometabola DSM 20162]SUP32363.1 ABC transporter arginine-binding protein precursor [Tsukamurella paurometabola]
MRRRARFTRLLSALAATVAAAALVSACSAGSTDSGASSSAYPIPTQDVVSSIAVDPAARALLPAGTTEVTLGLTRQPGVNNLPHGGEVPDGNPVGLDVDLRNAVAKALGISWKQEIGTFSTIIPGVQNGRYQVGQGNFGVTRPRLDVVDFATYLHDGQAFVGSANSGLTEVTTLEDLCGKKIVTGSGTTFQQILEKGAQQCAAKGKPAYAVQYLDEQGAIILSLQNNRVDAYFGPTLSLRYLVDKVPGTRFLGEYSTSVVGFVTAKGSPLAPAITQAVNTLIARGEYGRLFDKWKVPAAAVAKSEVNPAPAF